MSMLAMELPAVGCCQCGITTVHGPPSSYPERRSAKLTAPGRESGEEGRIFYKARWCWGGAGVVLGGAPETDPSRPYCDGINGGGVRGVVYSSDIGARRIHSPLWTPPPPIYARGLGPP